MAGLKKLTGRPKLENGKRVRKLDIRFTEEEYERIIAMEEEFGISKTELLRMRVLNDADKIIVNGAELLKALDAIGAELARSGNNINQLARHANSERLAGRSVPGLTSIFNRLMEDHVSGQQALESVLRQIIRLMGK